MEWLTLGTLTIPSIRARFTIQGATREVIGAGFCRVSSETAIGANEQLGKWNWRKVM